MNKTGTQRIETHRLILRAFRIEDAVTIEEAKEMAEKGTLIRKLLPPDYPLRHLPRTDLPSTMAKLVINGARMPVTPETEALPEGEPVRIYLEGSFWGIALRQGEELAWKAQIAPEEG